MSSALPSLRSLPLHPVPTATRTGSPKNGYRNRYGEIDDGLGPKDEFWPSVYDYSESLEFVPTTLYNYGVIAKRIVQKNGLELMYVPLDFPFYTALAVLAVKQNGDALQFVPRHLSSYWMLSKLAAETKRLTR